MDLYHQNHEAFYQLAIGGTSPLAKAIYRVVRDSYTIQNGVLESYRGETLEFPDDLSSEIKEFLREIDGKGTDRNPGKDYEGHVVSQAQVQFQLREYHED